MAARGILGSKKWLMPSAQTSPALNGARQLDRDFAMATSSLSFWALGAMLPGTVALILFVRATDANDSQCCLILTVRRERACAGVGRRGVW